jgi:hypothetical protein
VATRQTNDSGRHHPAGVKKSKCRVATRQWRPAVNRQNNQIKRYVLAQYGRLLLPKSGLYKRDTHNKKELTSPKQRPRPAPPHVPTAPIRNKWLLENGFPCYHCITGGHCFLRTLFVRFRRRMKQSSSDPIFKQKHCAGEGNYRPPESVIKFFPMRRISEKTSVKFPDEPRRIGRLSVGPSLERQVTAQREMME